MNDYWKCAVANKATLGGYCAALIGAATWTVGGIVGSIDDLASIRDILTTIGIFGISAGLSLNLGTGFGLETLLSYERTREHIRKTGTLDGRFYRAYSWTYCTSKGAQLAAREAGLEHLVKRT